MSAATSRVAVCRAEPCSRRALRTAGIGATVGGVLVSMLVALLLPVRAMAIPHGPGEEPIKVKMNISVSGEGGGNYVIGPSEANGQLSIKAKVGSTVTVSSGSTDTDDVLDGTQGPVSQSHMLTASWNLKGQQVQDDPQGYTPPQHQVQLEEGDLGDTVVITLSMSDDQTLYNDTNDPTATLNILVVGVTINLPVTLFGRGDQTHDPPDSTHFSATGTPGPGTYTWSSAAGIFDGDRDGHFGEEGDNVIVVDQGGSGCTMPFRATSIGKDVSVTVQYTYENITVSDSDEVTVVGVGIAGHDEAESLGVGQEVSLSASPSGPWPGTYLWAIPGTEGVDYQFTQGSATSQNITIKFLTAANSTVDVQFTYNGATPEKAVGSTREDANDEDEDGETNDFVPDPAPLRSVKINIIAGLTEQQEDNPGLYMNVNWNDDDGDGWTHDGLPPEAVYTGDKDDDKIDPGVDTDYVLPLVTLAPGGLPGKVKFTCSGHVKLWATASKKDAQGNSSHIPSGTEFDVGDFPIPYIEGISGCDNFRDAFLTAEYVENGKVIDSDEVKITVFEVELTGLYVGNQQEDCSVKHEDLLLSSNKNGKISWDDPDPKCKFFHNCMEDQGTVEPSGVTNEAQFDFKREQYSILWILLWGQWGSRPDLGAPPDPKKIVWQDDEEQPAEDNTPSQQNHIYQIDGPGDTTNINPPPRIVQTADLKDWVMISFDGGQSWHQCSGFLRWHSKVGTEPKNADERTRSGAAENKLGDGWIQIPITHPD